MAMPSPHPDSSIELNSGIIPMIHQYLAIQPGCNVVDFGAVTNNKFAIFSHNNARVYFDTTDHSLRAKISQINGHGEIGEDDVRNLLTTCPDKIDILLLWDLFDYLPLEVVALLAEKLSERMPPGALIYCLVSQQKMIPKYPAIMDVTSPQQLTMQSGPVELEAPRYSPKLLESKLAGFRIEKLYLLRNGIQEHLFFYEGTDL